MDGVLRHRAGVLERLLHFEEEIAALVRRGAVDSEPDADALLEHMRAAAGVRA